MHSFVVSCPKNIELLSVFLPTEYADTPLGLEMIQSKQLPQPYHNLLVHERDMTSTLAGFHKEPIALQVLEQRVLDGEVLRHVVLRGKRSGKPLEYGASRIRLDTLDAAARAEVLRGEEPFGGILNAVGLQYRSCPGGFLRIRPHWRIVEALQLAGEETNGWLFGRCNCLSRPGVGTLAEVVEILPVTERQAGTAVGGTSAAAAGLADGGHRKSD
jgi:hypothetical protein